MADEERNAEFKDACKAYSTLCDQAAEISSKLKEIKEAQNVLSQKIFEFMVDSDISEVQMGDGSKICCKISKRTSTINRQFLLEQLLPVVGGDHAVAEMTLERIYGSRTVEEKSVISRVKPRVSRKK